MKFYLVLTDIYADGYGSNFHIFGVYDKREKAEARIEELRGEMFINEDNSENIWKVELNTDCDIEVGGYRE